MRLPWRAAAVPGVTLDQVYAAVTLLGRKVDSLSTQMGIVMTQQDDVNAATATLTDAVSALTGAAGRIEAEIAALQAAHPALNLDALKAEVALLTPAVATVAAIAPAVPPAGA